MKIDFNKLKSIFGDTLPSKESFLANNDGHNVTQRMVRVHVSSDSKVKHNFSQVWALFVAEYAEFIKAAKPKVAEKVEKPVAEAKADDAKDE